MDLANPAFRNAEDVADLFHVQVFVVVERNDEALFLRQSTDRVRDDVLGLEQLEGCEGILRVLVLDDKTQVPVDILICATGRDPGQNLEEMQLEKAGIEWTHKEGIIVDSKLQSVSSKNVFAAGDCANAFNDLYGYAMRVESVPSANAHAKVIASSIIGNEVTNRELPWFWSDQYEFKLQMAGLSDEYDEIYIHGKIEDNSFMACYGKEGSLIAVDSVNMPKIFNNYKKALANSMRLSMDLVKDPNFDPSSIFSASY